MKKRRWEYGTQGVHWPLPKQVSPERHTSYTHSRCSCVHAGEGKNDSSTFISTSGSGYSGVATLPMASGTIHIGTSGWHYPHWIGRFYPKDLAGDQQLAFYTKHFRTVELNNTFYHLPSVSTVEHWAAETPKDFLFACKGSRYITHMKKLKDPEQSIKRFFEIVTILHGKLGPILFQLPPSWRVNSARLEVFLTNLPASFRYTFEFREESWFAQPVYDVLQKYNAAFCLYHLAGRWSPEVITADFVYIRLHGPDNAYQGNYSARTLRAWARKCQTWSQSGKDVYCYFDNDQNAYAPSNALTLQKIIQEFNEKPDTTTKGVTKRSSRKVSKSTRTKP